MTAILDPPTTIVFPATRADDLAPAVEAKPETPVIVRRTTRETTRNPDLLREIGNRPHPNTIPLNHSHNNKPRQLGVGVGGGDVAPLKGAARRSATGTASTPIPKVPKTLLGELATDHLGPIRPGGAIQRFFPPLPYQSEPRFAQSLPLLQHTKSQTSKSSNSTTPLGRDPHTNNHKVNHLTILPQTETRRNKSPDMGWETNQPTAPITTMVSNRIPPSNNREPAPQRLHGHYRHQVRVQPHSDRKTPPTIPGPQTTSPNRSVHHTPIRPIMVPIRLEQSVHTCHPLSPRAWNQHLLLRGRPVDIPPKPIDPEGPNNFHPRNVPKTGHSSKSSEMSTRTNTTSQIPWIHHQHQNMENISSSSESGPSSHISYKNPIPIEIQNLFSQNLGEDDWDIELISPSESKNPPLPTTTPPTPSPLSSTPPNGLQSRHLLKPHEGTTQLSPTPDFHQFPSNPNDHPTPTALDHDLIRRQQRNRLGGNPPASKQQTPQRPGTLDRRRKTPPHQHLGGKSMFQHSPGSESSSSSSDESDDIVYERQHSRKQLPTQENRSHSNHHHRTNATLRPHKSPINQHPTVLDRISTQHPRRLLVPKQISTYKPTFSPKYPREPSAQPNVHSRNSPTNRHLSSPNHSHHTSPIYERNLVEQTDHGGIRHLTSATGSNGLGKNPPNSLRDIFPNISITPTIETLLTATTTIPALKQRHKDAQRYTQAPGTTPIAKMLFLIDQEFNKGNKGTTIRRLLNSIARSNEEASIALQDPIIQFALKGASTLRPPSRKNGTSPDDFWDVNRLVEWVANNTPTTSEDKAKNMENLRLRAIIAIRVGSGVRSGDTRKIRRFSFKIVKTPMGQYVLQFTYVSKTSGGKANPFGYIERSPQGTTCLAQWVLDYLATQPPGDPTDASRDFLFSNTSDVHTPITADRIASITRKAMLEAGVDPRYTSHSIRFALVSKAMMQGADLNSVVSRFGWLNINTAREHYLLHVSRTNLSNLATVPFKPLPITL